MSGMHFGRSWVGHTIEDECPCPKAPCSLAAPAPGSPECAEHNPDDFLDSKTMRQAHRAKDCPA
mgnify:CR=1 FL=1